MRPSTSTRRRAARPRSSARGVSSSVDRCARRGPSGARTAGTAGARRRPPRHPVARHRADLRARRVDARDVALVVLVRRRRRFLVFFLGAARAARSARARARDRSRCRSAAPGTAARRLAHRARVARRGRTALGLFVGDAVEERSASVASSSTCSFSTSTDKLRGPCAPGSTNVRCPGRPNAPAPMSSTGSNSMISASRDRLRPRSRPRAPRRLRRPSGSGGSSSSRPAGVVALHHHHAVRAEARTR